MTELAQYCAERTGRNFPDFATFHAFSCMEFARFWELFLIWSRLSYAGDVEPVATDRRCETAIFFPRLQLSYAANLLAVANPEDAKRPAITAYRGSGQRERLSRGELRAKVARLALGLRQLGLRPGDRQCPARPRATCPFIEEWLHN